MANDETPAATDQDRAVASALLGRGIPTQTTLSASDSVVSASRQDFPIEVQGRTPGFQMQALASLPTDITDRAEFFSRALFPDLTTSEAMSRFGIRDGRLFYIDRDGTATWAEPDVTLSYNPNEISHSVGALGRSVGPALPMIGGIAGGLLASETGPGSVVGAAVGGGAGETVRQAGASALTRDNQMDLGRIGGAALQEGVGQMLGLGMTRFFTGRFGRVPMAQMSDARRLDRLASEVSGDTPFILTRAEASGNRALMRRQQYLSQYGGEGTEILQDFYNVRNAATRDALERYLGTFTTEESGYLVNARAIEIADAARARARSELSQTVRPYYEAAERMTDPDLGGRMLNPAPVVEHINTMLSRIPSRSGVARALRTAVGNLSEENGGTLTVMDAVKKELDAAILSAGNRAQSGAPGSSVAAGNVHFLTEARDILVNEIDRQFAARGGVVVTENGGRGVLIPDGESVYAVARNIFEEGVPTRTAAEQGLVGRVADLRGNRTLEAAGLLMNPNSSSVEQIRTARQYMTQVEGGEQAWDNLVGSWLRNAFDDLPNRVRADGAPNLADAFLRSISRNPRQQEMLIAATEHNPEMQEGLQYILEVFSAASRVPRGGSQTAFMQEAGRELTAESRRAATGPARAVSSALSVSEWGRILDDMSAGRHMSRVAELLTTPEGLTQLKAAREMAPSGRAALLVFAHILNGGTVGAIDQELNGPRDRDPVDTTTLTGATSAAPQGTP